MIACVQTPPHLKKDRGEKLVSFLSFRGGVVCTQANVMRVLSYFVCFEWLVVSIHASTLFTLGPDFHTIN